MGKEWYIIHTYSSHEQKVKLNLEKKIKSLGMEDKISRIVIPTEEVTERKKGKKVVLKKKLLPGYILIEMDMSDETWYAVRYTPGILGFIGGEKKKLVPLTKEEVANILERPSEIAPVQRPKILFEQNETIRIIDGPFKNFIGTVGDVDIKHLKLKIMIDILGRSTPVELEFHQVERL